jgi:hypothetical protein
MKKIIETKFTEERCVTSNPEEMINRFTAEKVLKTWMEDFVDGGTGEVVSIERNEVLFNRGVLIDRDTAAEIQFFIQSGDIASVEVSNQRRMGYKHESLYLRLYLALVQIEAKKKNILLYAQSVENVAPIITDYVELNYAAPFYIKGIREFRASIVLIDNFSLLDARQLDIPYPKEADTDEGQDAEEDRLKNRKYYLLDFNVEIEGKRENGDTAVVHTNSVDRGMMLIGDYIIKHERKRIERLKKEGISEKMRELTASLEAAKSVNIEAFIPKEFSEAYATDSE